MPGEQQQLIKIRDKRHDNRFYLDNEILDGYAKFIGIHAVGVYVALVRHSKNETCWPSIIHIGAELGISKSTVKRAIRKLLDYNIIMVEMKYKIKGGRGNNNYYLLDRTEWKPVPNWSNQPKEYRPFKGVSVASKT